MKSFTDNTGRTWTISVTVGTIKRVRALCNVDLANIVSMEKGQKPNAELLERLGSDPVLLADVLYAVCKPEADAKNVSDEDFGRALSGDAIDLATTALLDEIVDFFPEVKRKVFRKILDATRRFEAKGRQALDVLLNSPEMDQQLDEAIEKLMISSANVPGSAV